MVFKRWVGSLQPQWCVDQPLRTDWQGSSTSCRCSPKTYLTVSSSHGLLEVSRLPMRSVWTGAVMGGQPLIARVLLGMPDIAADPHCQTSLSPATVHAAEDVAG